MNFISAVRRAYTGVVQDITEKKQVQWSLERMTRQNELILKSVGDGIFGCELGMVRSLFTILLL